MKTTHFDCRDFNDHVFAQITQWGPFWNRSYSIRVVAPWLCVEDAAGYCEDREFRSMREAKRFAHRIYYGQLERVRISKH